MAKIILPAKMENLGKLLDFVRENATKSGLTKKDATQIIVVSRHLTEYLPSDLPVSVIPSGLDLDLFCPMPSTEARSRLGLSARAKLVLLFLCVFHKDS